MTKIEINFNVNDLGSSRAQTDHSTNGKSKVEISYNSIPGTIYVTEFTEIHKKALELSEVISEFLKRVSSITTNMVPDETMKEVQPKINLTLNIDQLIKEVKLPKLKNIEKTKEMLITELLKILDSTIHDSNEMASPGN